MTIVLIGLLLTVIFAAFALVLFSKSKNRAESALVLDLQSSLPGFSKVDIAQILILPSNDIFEIADTVEAVVFPRLPFAIKDDAKIRMRESLVEALTLHTKLTPAQAIKLSVLNDDQLAIALGSFQAIFEAAKEQGR